MHPEIVDFVRGAGIGLAVAAPVGPIGLLCIRRSLAEGRASGFATGLGAATADAAFAAIAAFGLTAATRWLVDQQLWLQPLGGAFLVWLGLRIFIVAVPAAPGPIATAARAGETGTANLAGAFGATFLLTLANPMTILSFAGIFAGVGAFERDIGSGEAAVLTGGVFAGSALWWLFLSQAAGRLRVAVASRPQGLRWINRVSGAVIGTFGVTQLAIATYRLWMK